MLSVPEVINGVFTGNTLYGKEAIRQRIEHAFKLVRGTYVRKTDAGFPWSDILGEPGITAADIQMMATLYLLEDRDVLDVESMDVTLDNRLRSVSLSATVRTTEGTVVVIV